MKLVQNLEQRFVSGALDVLSVLDNVLNPQSNPEGSPDVASHGTESLGVLFDHYGGETLVGGTTIGPLIDPGH